MNRSKATQLRFSMLFRADYSEMLQSVGVSGKIRSESFRGSGENNFSTFQLKRKEVAGSDGT